MTALGVLCCFALFVCLTLLLSFFLPSHLSFKNMYNYAHVIQYVVNTCIYVHRDDIPIDVSLGFPMHSEPSLSGVGGQKRNTDCDSPPHRG